MNEHDDKALDDYLAGDSALSASYREAGDEGPSAELDAAILGQARQAIADAGPTRNRAWFFPLSSAAVILLAAALVLEITMPGLNQPVPDRKAAMEAAPPVASSTPAPGDADVNDLVAYRENLAPAAAEARVSETGAPTSEEALARLKREIEDLRSAEQSLTRSDDASRLPELSSYGFADNQASAEAKRDGRAEADTDTAGQWALPPADTAAGRAQDESDTSRLARAFVELERPNEATVVAPGDAPAEPMADALVADAAPGPVAHEPSFADRDTDAVEAASAPTQPVAPDVAAPPVLAAERPAESATSRRVPPAGARLGLQAGSDDLPPLPEAQLQALVLTRIVTLAHAGDDEEAARLLNEALDRWPDLELPEDFPVPDPRQDP